MSIKQFSDLKGHTIKSITGEVGGEFITIALTDKSKFMLYHAQDCCESVYVEDIIGDLQDLVGSPLLMAEEVSNDETFDDSHMDYSYISSATWTFYKLATANGYVTIRWFGWSNGYYSEEVNFKQIA
jgi:hypothetical protein